MAGIAILFSWALAWLLLKGALLHGTWHMARQGWGGWFQSNVMCLLAIHSTSNSARLYMHTQLF